MREGVLFVLCTEYPGNVVQYIDRSRLPRLAVLHSDHAIAIVNQLYH